MTRLSRRSLLALTALALPLPALAQPSAWPERPIRLIIPVAPGGSLDILGRVMAREIGTALGQPIVPENMPGAGSNIAFEAVARARPDGHTLLVGSDPLTINPSLYRRIGFNPVRDFTPVAELVRAPQVLVVKPSMPAKTAQDYFRLAREAEGQMTIASQGNGSIGHLAGALLASRIGANFTHVPYRGGGPAVVDVMAGHVDSLLVTLPAAIEHIRAGRLPALAVSSAARSTALPELPTIAESGVAGYDVVTWQGILGPAGLPDAVVRRLNAALLNVLGRAEVRSGLEHQGFEVTGSSPEAFAAQIRAEAERWPPIVRASGATLD